MPRDLNSRNRERAYSTLM